MSELSDLVTKELTDKKTVHVEATLLHLAAEMDGLKYRRLCMGIFLPDIGAIDGMPEYDVTIIKSLAMAMTTAHTVGHEFARDVAGYDDPALVAPYRQALEQVKVMRPGDLAKLDLEGNKYVVAMLTAESPSTGLALFLKA